MPNRMTCARRRRRRTRTRSRYRSRRRAIRRSAARIRRPSAHGRPRRRLSADEAGRCSRAQPFEPIGEGLLSSKDISDCAAERSEKYGERARGSLLQRATMDVAEPRGDAVALLEVLRVYGAFVDRLQIRNAAELYRVHG